MTVVDECDTRYLVLIVRTGCVRFLACPLVRVLAIGRFFAFFFLASIVYGGVDTHFFAWGLQ